MLFSFVLISIMENEKLSVPVTTFQVSLSRMKPVLPPGKVQTSPWAASTRMACPPPSRRWPLHRFQSEHAHSLPPALVLIHYQFPVADSLDKHCTFFHLAVRESQALWEVAWCLLLRKMHSHEHTSKRWPRVSGGSRVPVETLVL